MWIRLINALLLLLFLPYCSSTIFLPSREVISEAKRKLLNNSTRDNTSSKPGSDVMMCKPLQQVSQLSNGDCSTVEPVYETVCSGRCVVKKEHGHPYVHQLITGQRYRCKPNKKVKKNVKALCHSNSKLTTIKIKVVESCKCVLTKPRKCKDRKNQTDKKCKNKKRRRKNRKNRRKNKQRKTEKSSKTNNDR